MPKLTKSFLDPAYSRLFQGTEDYFDYRMANKEDNYFKSSMNNATEGTFQAVILSGLISGETAGTGGDYTQDIQQVKKGKNVYYKVKIRPLDVTFGNVLPDPCDPEHSPKVRMKLVMAHPWALSDYTMSSDDPPLYAAQIVNCYYEEGTVGNGNYSKLRFEKPNMSRSTPVNARCLTSFGLSGTGLKDLFFGRVGFDPTRSGGGGGGGPNASGGGAMGGTVPQITGDIQPISSWAGNASKNDLSFSRSKCNKALTGAYASLPRKDTWFFKYKKEDVVKAITQINQPDHIKYTMFAFMRKEQPRYYYPNNNVAGIQTGRGMFRGTTISDYDYQTCFRDADTMRAFAGFNSLPRGLVTFGAAIAGKYAGTDYPWKKIESGDEYNVAADKLVWNYYSNWNIKLKADKMEKFRREGEYRYYSNSKGEWKTKKWQPNLDYFAKKLKEFDEIVASLST